MHQQFHEVSINVEEGFTIVRCGESMAMVDGIPDYCPYCDQEI